MEILVIADIHNDTENIINYTDKLLLLNFDLIVAVGDFTDVNLPKGFTNIDMGELIIEELSVLKKPILAVPGNFDKDLIEFFEKKGFLLHGNGKVINGIGFYGFGGARTPFGTPLEPSEEEIEKGLKKGFEEVEKTEKKIQVTHMPPVRTKLDVIASGAHVGSEIIRKFIEEKKPVAAISAHIHEARGTDELNSTKLINSGRFPEGYCGLISIGEEKTATKIINLI